MKAGEKVEWYRLSNGYWLRIIYYIIGKNPLVWSMAIVVGKTRRACNDSHNKSEKSPKILECKSTNHNINGIEALSISLKSLMRFERTRTCKCGMQIGASDDQRFRVYSRLTHYGYRIINQDGVYYCKTLGQKEAT